MPDPLAPDLVDAIEAFRQPDGGFGPSVGAAPEAEPTALAAIALDDDRARAWLASNQSDDGGFVTGPLDVRSDAATPLAAIALREGSEGARAIDYLLGQLAWRQGDPETARREYRRALELNGGYRDAEEALEALGASA